MGNKYCSYSHDCEDCGDTYYYNLKYDIDYSDNNINIKVNNESDNHKNCHIKKCCGIMNNSHKHRDWCSSRIPKTDTKHNWKQLDEGKMKFECSKCDLKLVIEDSNIFNDFSYYFNDLREYLTYCTSNDIFLRNINTLEKQKENYLNLIKKIEESIEENKKKQEGLDKLMSRELQGFTFKIDDNIVTDDRIVVLAGNVDSSLIKEKFFINEEWVPRQLIQILPETN